MWHPSQNVELSDSVYDLAFPTSPASLAYTEMRFNLCMWLGEIYSVPCLTVMPGPAWVLLNKICKD